MIDINLGNKRYHPVITFITVVYAIRIFRVTACTTAISEHEDSVYHKNSIKNNSLSSSNDDNLPIKKIPKSIFHQHWLDIIDCKCWFREIVTRDTSSLPCSR